MSDKGFANAPRAIAGRQSHVFTPEEVDAMRAAARDQHAKNTAQQAAQASQASDWSLNEKLLMRLHVRRGAESPFEYMNAIANPTGGNTVVFIICRGKPVVLQDESVMFPSDALIGQINLLR